VLLLVSHSIIQAQPLLIANNSDDQSDTADNAADATPGTPQLPPPRRTRLTDAKSVCLNVAPGVALLPCDAGVRISVLLKISRPRNDKEQGLFADREGVFSGRLKSVVHFQLLHFQRLV